MKARQSVALFTELSQSEEANLSGGVLGVTAGANATGGYDVTLDVAGVPVSTSVPLPSTSTTV